MGIFSKLFGRKSKPKQARIGGMEDFMTLIRVYYQSAMAVHLGISNLSALPDLRVFKQTLHVATVNNRLGIGERAKCRNMLIDVYGMQESFFKEIDNSIKKGCRNINDVRGYFMLFQGFSQELMMVMGNLMQWKFRLPSFFHKALRGMTEKTVHDILFKNTWKDEGVRRACVNIRQFQQRLGYSEQWMVEYTYRIIMLAKKEPKPTNDDIPTTKS